MAIPPLPAVGDQTAGSWADIIAGWGQAWTAYTPALTASVTNPTLGTASQATGQYMQVGKTTVVDLTIIFGTSGAAAGSGTYGVSMPVSMAFGSSGLVAFGHIRVAGLFTPVHGLVSASPSTVLNLFYITTAINGALTAVTNALPGVWTNNDLMRLRVIGQAA